MANDLLFASTLMIQLPTHDIGSVCMSLKDGQCSLFKVGNYLQEEM